MSSKMVLQCETCGKSFERFPSQAARFCSRRCRDTGMAGQLFTVICPTCGKTFEQPAKRQSAGVRFCSHECFLRRNGDRVTLTCKACGKLFHRTPSSVKWHPNLFCSRQCHSALTRKAASVSDRFWPNVDRQGPNDCWEWTRHKLPNGYGQIGIAGRSQQLAHRVSYCLANECTLASIKVWCVMHTCDNRSCVNPSHLSLGTYADNNADMKAKGRQARGERQGGARLTPARVLKIRAACESGPRGTQSRMATKYGVSKETISHIVLWHTWKHVK